MGNQFSHNFLFFYQKFNFNLIELPIKIHHLFSKNCHLKILTFQYIDPFTQSLKNNIVYLHSIKQIQHFHTIPIF